MNDGVLLSVRVYEHADFQVLWSQFELDLAQPLSQPLTPEVIVVPGAGWESYITRRLVKDRGSWANYTFSTLGRWISQTLRDALGPDEAPTRDVDALTWAIAASLPDLLGTSPFVSLQAYLEQAYSETEVKRLVDLSRCIAGLFDQYLLFRPGLVAAWQSGKDWPIDEPAPPHAAWQRRLFEAAIQTVPVQSVQASIHQLDDALKADAGDRLPERVTVWVAGGLPPAQIAFLDTVGRHFDVRLYVIAPSHVYWADMADRRSVMRRLRDSELTLREFCEQEHIDLMHPLMASMGRLSRERQLLLVDQVSETWLPSDPPEPALLAENDPSLLAGLQKELHAAHEPEPVERECDASLTIHNCHSAIREVEVLRDQIRDALEAAPQLRAEDVVVLCPDLETYASLIQAVFGASDRDPSGHLPFHLAGRSPRRTRPLIEAYFQLLEVLRGRMNASTVLDLLNLDWISGAAGLDPEEVDVIAEWAGDAGIRWGLDPHHRKDEGLPESDLNTWRFGLDRLLLGYAMPAGGGQLFGQTLALDRAEGMSSETLGKLWSLITRLERWHRDFEADRTCDQWRKPLCELLDEMIATRDDEAAAQKIRDAVDHIAQLSAANGFEAAIPFRLVCDELTRQVDAMAGGSAFRLGHITFCEPAAMRSLPFAVVGLLGMNDGDFPRMDRPVGFDLMTRAAQLGDRSARLEDKHLFLEAILSAKQRLIITYQGQSLRDQRSRPPSIVVEELLDSLDPNNLGSPDDTPSLRDRVVVRHALQAFSPRYFSESEGGTLYSYDTAQLKAAKALTQSQQPPPAFVSKPLADAPGLEEVATRSLVRLVQRPWEIYLSHIGASLRDLNETDSDREPLVPNALERWQLGDVWVRSRLAGEAPETLTAKLRRGGLVPGGALGSETLEVIASKAEPIIESAQALGVVAEPNTLTVRLALGGTLIKGHLLDLTDVGIRRATYATVDAKRMTSLWIDHLLLSAACDKPGLTSVLVGRGKKPGLIEFPPIDTHWAQQQLEGVMQLYRLAHRLPLPFFPASVKSVIEAATRSKSPIDLDSDEGAEQAIAEAKKGYTNTWNTTAPAQLLSVRTAFAGRDPFAMTCDEIPGLEADGPKPLFLKLFALICQPMLRAMNGEGGGADA